ncbi:branched-chain amino acid aminotransferase [Peribacillus asahii]|uniref:branched-chain amino acid aminotransferase n=1 Tax=Peribacillus asahii TaxID=228899 RepID=UPI0037F4BAD8
MLKTKIEQHIKTFKGDQIALHKEEKEYVEKHQLLEGGMTIVEKDAEVRFTDAYIERSDKEFENLIAVETSEFLHQPLTFLKTNKKEFLYLESKWFELIGVDAVSLEVDDLFGTYEALLGLKLQKKYDKAIRSYLQAELQGENAKFALMFSAEDGLWNFNFSLNDVKGFTEDMTIGEAYQFIYQFLFKLMEAIEEG